MLWLLFISMLDGQLLPQFLASHPAGENGRDPQFAAHFGVGVLLGGIVAALEHAVC